MKMVWTGLWVLGLVGLGWVMIGKERVSEEVRQELPRRDRERGMAGEVEEIPEIKIEEVARDLVIPWELVELGDGSLLVTQRPGTLVRIDPEQKREVEVAGVVHVGEGGLQGMAMHPNYEENNWLYLYLTTESDSGLVNRVERYKYSEAENRLEGRVTILDGIPGARVHDGGRMAFGPDGKLYVTTGDAGREAWAQDINSLAGKILRLNDDGSQPQDNPFGNLVYSWGHRNPQGLSWDEAGRLWATEHGPSGIGSGFDEINLIEKGGNYGWPDIKGDEEEEGMIRPIWHSGSRETWAPAGMEVMGDNIFFVGLRGETLYRGKMRGEEWEERKDYFEGDYGRLRIVKQSRDEQWLYLGTSNRDGRGRVREGDDKLIRVHRSYFEDL